MGGRVSLEGTSGWNEGGFWTSITPPHVPDRPRLLCSELLFKIFQDVAYYLVLTHFYFDCRTLSEKLTTWSPRQSLC